MSHSASTKARLVKLAPMLPLAVAGVVAPAHANEPQELAVTKAKAEQQQSYQAAQSTSHKNSKPLLETPKTITVINQDLMRDQGVTNLREALGNVAGISLAAGEGGAPTGDSLSIRGFSARTDIFIDGMRDVAGYYRDTYNLEAVEISKGPSSAMTGRGATGGSVNLATKSAKLDDFSEITGRLGSESDHRLTFDSNVKLNDDSALRINLMTEEGDVAGRDYVNNSRHALAVSAATGIGSATRLSVNAEYQVQDNLPDYGLPWVPNNATGDLESYRNQVPNVPYSNFYGNVARDYEDIEAKIITAKAEHDLSANTTVRAQGRVGNVKRESIVTAPRFLDATTSSAVRLSDEKTRDTEDKLHALQLDLLGRYFTGSAQHDIVAGVEYSKEQFLRWDLVSSDDNLADLTVDLYQPVQLPYTGHYQRAGGDGTDATGTTTALYVFDTITLNNEWQLTGGVRYDQFDVDYHYDYNDASKVLSTDDGELSWNAAALYKASADSNWYLALGSSFNPTAEALTFSSSNNQKDLDPEQTQSIELGVKQQWLDGNLATHAALFRVTKDNARTRESSTEYSIGGKQRVQGVELSAVGTVSPDLQVIASVSWQDSEVLKAGALETDTVGNELARTPEFSASVWAQYQLNEQWQLGLGNQYVGERFSSSSTASRRTAPSYNLVNFTANFHVNAQLSLQLQAKNLTDEQYISEVGGGHAIPGEGRYFGLNANYRF